MFELIAILGLAGIIVCCAVNLVEMSLFGSEEEAELRERQAKASQQKHAA